MISISKDIMIRFVIILLISTTAISALHSIQIEVSAAQEQSYQAPLMQNVSNETASKFFENGKQIFRYDTFGDESFWGDQLKLYKAIEGEEHGGIGPGVSPKTALSVGLKVDEDALPQSLVEELKMGKINLSDPAITLALLKLNAVVGVQGSFNNNGSLKSVGITCALCHSNVDDSFAPGIGHRRDGWPNRDLNVGAIIGLSPNLQPFEDRLGANETVVREVLNSWGPGKFDAILLHDGIAFRPDGKSASVVIPAAYGLAGVNLATYTGWGTVTHWNAFVSNTLMKGKGTFYEPRLNDPQKFPLDAKFGTWNIRNNPDLITPKLAALHFYQLALIAPKPPENSYNQAEALRGQQLFDGKAQCSRCHVPPLFTEPGWNMHSPEEIGIDSFQANRSPTDHYRTTPLNGLFARSKGGFYHDGRFPTLIDVVNHYNSTLNLGLKEQEKRELVEYLKSI